MMAGSAREDHLYWRRVALVVMAVACAYGWNLYSAEKALSYRNAVAEAAVERAFKSERAPILTAISAKEAEITAMLAPVVNPHQAHLDAVNEKLRTMDGDRRNAFLRSQLLDEQYVAADDARRWADQHAKEQPQRKAFAAAQKTKLESDLAAVDTRMTAAKGRAMIQDAHILGLRIDMQLFLAFLVETIKLVAIWAGSVYNRNGRAAK